MSSWLYIYLHLSTLLTIFYIYIYMRTANIIQLKQLSYAFVMISSRLYRFIKVSRLCLFILNLSRSLDQRYTWPADGHSRLYNERSRPAAVNTINHNILNFYSFLCPLGSILDHPLFITYIASLRRQPHFIRFTYLRRLCRWPTTFLLLFVVNFDSNATHLQNAVRTDIFRDNCLSINR